MVSLLCIALSIRSYKVSKHSGDILKQARYSAGSSAYSSFKSNVDQPCVLLQANHFHTHTFFSLAIPSSSTSAICTSSNLDNFNYSSTFFPVHFTFDSIVNVCKCCLLRYLLSFTCSKLRVHLPCLSTGLIYTSPKRLRSGFH